MDRNTDGNLNSTREESKDLSALITMIEILRVDYPDMVDALYTDLACHLAKVHHDWTGTARERFNSVYGVIRDCRDSLKESAFAVSDVKSIRRRLKT